MTSHMPTLREILAEEPSRKVWNELTALFQRWPAGAERQMALEYTAQHLEHWEPWIRRATLQDPSSVWPLVHQMDLQSHNLNKKTRFLLQTSTHIRSVSIRGAHLRNNLEFFQNHPRIDELRIDGCSRWRDLELLRELPHLTRLELFFSRSLRSLRGLEALEGLQELELVDCSRLDDFSLLEQLPRLQKLRISGANAVQHLQLPPLPGLTHLRFYYMERLESITGLETLESLEELELEMCVYLRNGLEDIVSLPHLHLLNLKGCGQLQVLPRQQNMMTQAQVEEYKTRLKNRA